MIDKISKKNIELNLRGDFSPLKKSKYSVVKLFSGINEGAGVLIKYKEKNYILTALHVVSKSEQTIVVLPFDEKCLKNEKKKKFVLLQK